MRFNSVSGLAAVAAVALAAAGGLVRAVGAHESFADALAPALEAVAAVRVVPGGQAREVELARLIEEFFGEEAAPSPSAPGAGALGAGFLLQDGALGGAGEEGSAGLMVTAAHVVAGAGLEGEGAGGPGGEVRVRFLSGSEHAAEVLGRDDESDIALLRVADPPAVAGLEWGDDAALRVGDWVVALGHPLGLEGSAAAGIIAATGRRLPGDPLRRFLQLDAAIRPGNSGGPLLNADGEVVGVVAAVFSPEGQEGAGGGAALAVPATRARRAAESLLAYGAAVAPWLGVYVEAGTAGAGGVLVAAVAAASPAAAAGLAPGDLLFAVDGAPLREASDLPAFLRRYRPGDEVVLGWRRGAADVEQRVRLAARAAPLLGGADGTGGAAGDAGGERGGAGGAGSAAGDAGTEERLRAERRGAALAEALGLGLEAVPGGVLVADSGAAAAHGVEPGDVITDTDEGPVTEPAELHRALARMEAKGFRYISVHRRRGKGTAWEVLPLPSLPEAPAPASVP